jgi:hypothetical protein
MVKSIGRVLTKHPFHSYLCLGCHLICDGASMAQSEGSNVGGLGRDLRNTRMGISYVRNRMNERFSGVCVG